MQIINLTPHSITIVDENDMPILVLPKTDVPARVSCSIVTTGETINGIPVTANSYSDIENLPAPAEDTVYIVSSIVASRCKNRNDVFVPNESVRNDAGIIIGCRSLGRV